MKIIDKRKDCYDYLQGVFGIDEHLTLDRREWNDFDLKYYLTYHNYKESEFMMVLLIGSMQYIFRVDPKFEHYFHYKTCISFQLELLDKRRIKRIPSSHIVALNFNGHFPLETWESFCSRNHWKNFNPEKGYQHHSNFLLRNLNLLSIIPPEEIWNEISSFLLFNKEPQVTDNQTDVQKLESKGFDKKSSFRHPIK